MLAPVSMHVALETKQTESHLAEQDGAMLAPVSTSMHVVLETTGADRLALIYDVLFCHGASPSSTKGFSIGRIHFPKDSTLVLTVTVPVRPI